MPQAFDPHDRWLGISPEDQPPHDYRLLGIRVFEGNAEVIQTAARVCLPREDKKAAYDAQWRSRLVPPMAGDAPAAVATPADDPVAWIATADAWWKMAQSCDDERKRGRLSRAGPWYEQARQRLPAGLDRTKAEKRLGEIAAEESKDMTPGRAASGAMPRGRWGGIRACWAPRPCRRRHREGEPRPRFPPRRFGSPTRDRHSPGSRRGSAPDRPGPT